MQPANNYYFKIRIKDKNGNYSELSNQIVAFTGAANVTNFKAIGDSTFIKLMWDANYQNNCNGFNIYRKTITTPYQLIASWQSDSTLVGNPEGASYTYYDTTCEQNILYKFPSQKATHVTLDIMKKPLIVGILITTSITIFLIAVTISFVNSTNLIGIRTKL